MAFCSQCGSPLPEGARFCASCGVQVGDNPTPETPPVAEHAAVVAPATPPNPSQSSGGGAGWILPLVIVVALAVIGIMLWSQRVGTRPIAGDNVSADGGAPVGPDVTTGEVGGSPASQTSGDSPAVTASSLDVAFTTDPATAAQRYAGPVTITGTVATTASGPTATLSLEGRTPFNFVLANFANASLLSSAGLRKGGYVRLSCAGVSQLAGTTILRGCTLG